MSKERSVKEGGEGGESLPERTARKVKEREVMASGGEVRKKGAQKSSSEKRR